MIGDKKDSHGATDRSSTYIDIWSFTGRIVENAAFPPVHWAPNNGGAIGIGAARGVDPQLAAKVIGGIGRAPGDAGTVAGAGCHIYLRIDTGLEGTSIAPDPQGACPKIGVGIVEKGRVAVENELRPTVWNLARG